MGSTDWSAYGRPRSRACCDPPPEPPIAGDRGGVRRAASRLPRGPRRLARPVVHQHGPHPRDGCGAAGRLGPPRHGNGAGAAGLRVVAAPPALQSGQPRLVRARSLRVVGGARLHAALRGALPHRVRPLARRPQAVPPVGESHAGPLRARAHPGCRGLNRPGHSVVDHHTYFLASDGDLMEGISHEACSLAGHLKLGKLIGFYDDNRITIDGSTDLAFSDDTAKRFESYGWHVQRIADGNDLDAIDDAITQAKRVTDRPSLIIVRTHIAWGSPHKQDTADAHGAPLGVDEVKATKQNLGWPSLEPFYVPDEALAHWRRARTRGARLEADWRKKWDAYRAAHPDLAAELERRIAGRLPAGWDAALPVFGPKDAQATRAASGKVLNALAAKLPELIGGSADLTGSNNTEIKGGGAGRNFHYGVREHAMGAVLNGIALHRGFIPFGGTFLIFSDYMRPSIRLAALTHLKPIYVFTH